MLINKGTELFQSPGPNRLFYLRIGVVLKQLFHQRMQSLQCVDLLDS